MTSQSSPPDFSTWISNITPETLQTILLNRPDTIHPAPPNFDALAARLQLQASIHRALRHCNATELAVLEAAMHCGGELEPLNAPTISAFFRDQGHKIKDAPLKDAIQTLIELALCYGTTEQFFVVPNVFNALETTTGLLGLSATEISTKLANLTPAQQRIIDTLLASDGVGVTKDAAPDADPTRPIPQLIALGILERTTHQSVRLPPRVRAVLKQHSLPEIPLFLAATASNTELSAPDIGQALEVVRLMRQLIQSLSEAPIDLLKSGELGVRPLQQLATQLEVPQRNVAMLLSIAHAASLVDRDEQLAPTTFAPAWEESPLAAQWAWLVQWWWLRADTCTWLIPEQHKFFAEDATQRTLPELKKRLFHAVLQYRDANPAAAFRFMHPLLALRIDQTTIDGLLEEATWLGLFSTDGVSSRATTLLDALNRVEFQHNVDLNNGVEANLHHSLLTLTAELTPETTTQLISQGDMTILAPGPIDYQMSRTLQSFADAESLGIATQYRISESSIQRAFEHGFSEADLSNFLQTHVLGEVPASMLFLISEIAQRQGHIRGGVAMCYIRSNDPSAIAQLVHSKTADEVALRAIAPTVAIAQASLGSVIEAYRKEHIQITAEDAHGATVSLRPRPTLVDISPTIRVPLVQDMQAKVDSVMQALQHQGRNGAHHGADIPSVLQAAIRNGANVTLGFVDNQGASRYLEVTPIALASGRISVADAQGTVQHIALHRISEVLT